MLEHGREALALVRGVDRSSFQRDRILQLAVVRLLEIVGEAAPRTPETVRDQHPAVPWRRITGLRNRLVHAYDTVDLGIVWSILTGDLPDLVAQLEAILGTDPE